MAARAVTAEGAAAAAGAATAVAGAVTAAGAPNSSGSAWAWTGPAPARISDPSRVVISRDLPEARMNGSPVVDVVTAMSR
ncbi:hypothetical protein D1871_14005 [Nakamurella silvestris]|nr:hypothetical protein D1871_14005 [Nakamurella silvestris]